MISIASGVRPRREACAAPRFARLCMLGGTLVVLGACNAEPQAGEVQSAPAAGVDAPYPEPAAAGVEAAMGEVPESGTDCPVQESRDWSARIEDGDSDGRRLHVSGEIDLPTPGYTASWSEGPADRRMPPAQHLLLELTPPDGIVAQVVTRLEVAYEGPATYPEYRAILVRCGNVVLASITAIDDAG